jgi:hypothetical protein
MDMWRGGGGGSYFLRILYNAIKGPQLQYFNKNKQTKRDTKTKEATSVTHTFRVTLLLRGKFSACLSFY